jgi:Na+-transporting NADH:ubiquinone oxidoreductase subunit C
MPNDSPLKSVLVAFIVCLVGSILVAGSAVLLRPAQIANKERDRKARIADLIARVPDVGKRFQIDQPGLLEARVVDLASGRYEPSIDAARFDQRRAARDPQQSVKIAAARDLAQIKRRARFAVVYLVRDKGQLKAVILPVHGRGYGSVLYGYLALAADTRTVIGLSFYEHGETPGLGALIDSPAWRGKWQGKKVWDDGDKPGLGVAKGKVDPKSPKAAYLVDGLTGATWTSRGVTSLLRFWLGEDGFGPYLRRIRDRRG